MIANQKLLEESKRQKRNIDAEDRFVRRKFWGSDETAEEPEEMGNTILGDVTNPTPVVVAGQPSSGLGALAATALVALGMSVPVAGVGGYLLNQALTGSDIEPTPATEQTIESLNLGLGRIEDYQK